jgi:peroxiredoxin
LKYPEKQFELYDKNCFSTISWEEVFAGRRVLICSLNRLGFCFIQNYTRDIVLYSEMYKLLGIDQVYFLTKSGLPYATLTNRDQGLPCLGDYNSEFLVYLDKLVNKTEHPVTHLSSFWTFQALINDGEVEQITQQPLENYLVTMLKDTKNVKALQKIGLKNEKMIWTPTFLARTLTLARDVYFYRVHPNIALKEHLLMKFSQKDK